MNKNELIDRIADHAGLSKTDANQALNAITHVITQAITELNASKISDMGKIMAHLKHSLHGRADMSQVSAIIKAQLS